MIEAGWHIRSRVAEKAQFTLAAEGTRVTPWGIKLAGAYMIRGKSCST
jgi:hypothetical protein